MDVAMAVFVRGVLKWMVKQLRAGSLVLPAHAMLVQDFRRVVARGNRARVYATHLRHPSDRSGTTSPEKVLLALLEAAACETPAREQGFLPLVERQIRMGNLAERIVRVVRRYGGRTSARRAAAIRGIYGDFMECLEHNTPWDG